MAVSGVVTTILVRTQARRRVIDRIVSLKRGQAVAFAKGRKSTREHPLKETER